MTSKNWIIPTISFPNSLEMEARRILFITASLTHNWYQKHDFLILKELSVRVPTSQVIVPDLAYNSISKYWSRVAKLKLATPIDSPTLLLYEVMDLLNSKYNQTQYDKHSTTIKNNFSSIQNKFWNNLFTLFPKYQNNIKNIHVFSTKYGPSSTFSLADKPDSTITIYLRQDSGIDQLLWTILASLFRGTMESKLKLTWEEIETTIDWIMSESNLSCGLPIRSPVIKNIRSDQMAEYRRRSQAHLTTLGFIRNTNWEQKITNLSKNEQLLLEVLAAKHGETVTYDEIASIIWPKGENFSLFAISKEIERLRKRIKNSGINIPVIHTHRKVGYSLL